MSELNILVTIPFDETEKPELEAICPDASFTYCDQDDADEALIAAADIILGNAEVSLIKESPRLKWIHLSNAGADIYTKPGVLAPGTILTNSSGAYGLNISEHMIGMLLMMMKKLDRYYVEQLNKNWADRGQVRSIYGSRILIVGLGDIGGQFAKKVHALGAYTVGIKRHLGEKPDYLDELKGMDELDQELAKADVVACSLPASSKTYHLFDAERFRKMNPNAIIINVGRGSLIDSYALCDALNNDVIAGACLDVVEPEPLPTDHPLWDAKHLIITPHASGYYHLPETLKRIKIMVMENLRAYVSGSPLKNKVDMKTGYRDNTAGNILM